MADSLQQAKDEYKDAKEAMREQHARMRQDLKFSNPSDPQQWEDSAKTARKDRPQLTFDRTNQFIMQVVNDGRQNKPAIHCLPADSQADAAVADKLNGLIRHIEYVSRAGQAYDMALEHAARVGLGWMRVVPEVMRPDTNEQEIRIKRVHDPLSIVLDANSVELDGSDAMCGFAETVMSNRAFELAYPKGKKDNWESEGWFTQDTVRLCEYFKVKETKSNQIILADTGEKITEDEYWKVHQATGVKLPVHDTFESKARSVKWSKMTGCEILEETDFPSQWVPLVPVYGYELWLDGVRYVCGITRRLMDSQKAYNYERSAFIESVAMQPKAPFMAAWESIQQHEGAWQHLNHGNPAFLPFNAFDDEGRPLPMPQRVSPPAFPVAFAQGGQIASQDMEAAIGMFKANLGQQGNETSGRAITARQREGDTANFHYIDNRNSGIEQLGRIVVDMIPRIYDQKRQARIMGEDGNSDFVEVDPQMPEAVRKKGTKVVAINPNVGAYDVRIKSGPGYTTIREEAAQNLVDISQGNPQLAAAMAPMLMKFRDMPEADKMARVAMAMLPPEVQKAYGEEEGEELPPQVTAKMQSMQQQIQQLSQALENAAGAADDKEHSEDIAAANMQINAHKAVTARLQMLMPSMAPEQVQAVLRKAVLEDFKIDLPELPDDHPAMQMQDPTAPPPGSEPMEEQSEPAEAGFSSPETA